ncbi:MAG: MogA/MoaB family molybdenum cofactor biosynthesis protein [Desulfobulbaceae bacterium]|jgi:molybdopterin adenylyltransferase|nr:MogA/MoaB family molybdenum cofactor biosynthesis protein [Desulfobulbaceae bacterium]
MVEKTIFKCGILTMSDKGSQGLREDTSGPQLKKQIEAAGPFEVREYSIVADNPEQIKATLLSWVDDKKLDLILTTGGTGVSPTDQAPETTLPLLDKEIPGISEAMRAASIKKTVNAILSRGVSGIRKSTLIINLPGSERGARENLDAVITGLEHAVYKINGGTKDCGAT